MVPQTAPPASTEPEIQPYPRLQNPNSRARLHSPPRQGAGTGSSLGWATALSIAPSHGDAARTAPCSCSAPAQLPVGPRAHLLQQHGRKKNGEAGCFLKMQTLGEAVPSYSSSCSHWDPTEHTGQCREKKSCAPLYQPRDDHHPLPPREHQSSPLGRERIGTGLAPTRAPMGASSSISRFRASSQPWPSCTGSRALPSHRASKKSLLRGVPCKAPELSGFPGKPLAGWDWAGSRNSSKKLPRAWRMPSSASQPHADLCN